MSKKPKGEAMVRQVIPGTVAIKGHDKVRAELERIIEVDFRGNTARACRERFVNKRLDRPLHAGFVNDMVQGRRPISLTFAAEHLGYELRSEFVKIKGWLE
jgi:hypothetical protein